MKALHPGVGLLLALLVSPSLAQEPRPGIKEIRRLDRSERAAGELPYLLYLPAAYPESEEVWPLLVYLHGSRGSGTDPGKLSRYPIPRIAESGSPEVPFVVLAPQCPSGVDWTAVDGLEPLIERISGSHRIDRARIYLVGQSMGADGVWHLARKSPERYAAIAPMFGAADPSWAPRLEELPIWIYHGERDNVVPVERADEMVAALRQAGSTSVRYTRDPEGYHRPPADDAFVELFAWLASHRIPTVD